MKGNESRWLKFTQRQLEYVLILFILGELRELISTILRKFGITLPSKPLVRPVAWRQAASRKPGPMRIFHVSHNLNLEGAPLSQFELARQAARAGDEVTLVANCDGPLRAEYEREGIAVRILHSPERFSRTAAAYEDALISYAEALGEGAPDLLHVNTLQAFAAIDAGRLAGIPTVWNIRESEPPDEFFGYLPSAIKRRALACCHYPEALIFVAEATCRVWDVIPTTVPRRVIRNALAPERRDYLARSWTREAARKALGLDHGTIMLVEIGTLCRRKGQADLLVAAELLDVSCAGNYQIALVGDCSGEEGRKIMRMAERMAQTVRRKVVFYGRQQDVALYLRAADLYVCTSYHESYPRTLLEAMHCNLPIITTPVYGIVEQVKEGMNAVFFAPGDHQALATKLAALIDGADERQRLAAGSANALAHQPNFETMVAAYAQVHAAALEAQE